MALPDAANELPAGLDAVVFKSFAAFGAQAPVVDAFGSGLIRGDCIAGGCWVAGGGARDRQPRPDGV